MNKIAYEKGDIITDTEGIQKIVIRTYFKKVSNYLRKYFIM